MAKAIIHFNYGPYLNSHGTTPKGRGAWAFEIEISDRIRTVFSPAMTIDAARTWVRAEVRKTGVSGVVEIAVPP
jgi:hypothetical protein